MPKLRSEINDSDKWAVNDIYENDASWEKSFEALRKEISVVEAFQGKLKSAAVIAEFYKVSEKTELEMDKLYTYAHMKHDEDTANSSYRSMQDKIYSVCVEYGEKMAWVAPEMMEIDDKTMTEFLNSQELAPYKFSIEKLLRKKNMCCPKKRNAFYQRQVFRFRLQVKRSVH